MPRWSAFVAVFCLLIAPTAQASLVPCAPQPLQVEGLRRVSPSAIDELLPRASPACFTDGELAELERRLWSLGIFDKVEVRRWEGTVVVTVREKWTLIPGADLSIGRSLSDSFVLLSLAEANLFGRAQVLYAYGAYVQRQLGGEISWWEHEPKGFRLLSELLPGGFIDADSKLHNRSSVTVQGLSAIRLTDTTGILVNTVAEAANPGDPNHSYLLGTIRGVRGLPDNLYRDAAHAFTNVELRFATQLVPRWYLQGVVFSDAATYVRMNEVGGVSLPASALGAGIGVRVVPTVFALVVPRLDVGSLLWPAGIPFFNFGFSQYF